ncbi:MULTISPECIES: hypothetical protein [Streptomyces]|uniref:Lipoprotein n=1 Tax=Streptomyces tendae TaxID=1932 RepID=A0ABX5ZL84_STRTE|nr:hypothetical protein [Streptomyces tendae]QER85059.1 hypothetical protein F3L20_03535 [Streptomyces tendae]
MRTSSVRRTALAASAAALAVLVTACGGSGDDQDKADEGKGKAAPTASSAAPAKALTAAELEKAALAQADVKSGKVATQLPPTDDIAVEKVETKDAACLPLAHAQAGVAQGEPAASVKRSWTGDPVKPSADAKPEDALLAALDTEKMLINLASYDGDGAERAVKGLVTAAEKCAGGFKATVVGEPLEVAKVATGDAPDGGDEGAAVTLTVAADEGVKAPAKIVVVRKGSTVATFSAVNLASMATGKDFEVPADVVAAQAGKLG